MKDFKFTINNNVSRPNPSVTRPVPSKSPQINFAIVSKNAPNSTLFNKIMNKSTPYDVNRPIEKSPVPFNYNNQNPNYQNSKSPLKLLNYLYAKQQESTKKAHMNINPNAKQFIQMKLQNDSVNAVYQINLKKSTGHPRAQSMHRDPQPMEKEINSSKDRIVDKSPLKIVKNFPENKSFILNRKSSAQEKNSEETNRNMERSMQVPEKIEFKIGKSFDRSFLEKMDIKRKNEEDRIKMLVLKQKEEQESVENNVEENIDNHNKNYNFEPFVNFTNFKNIQLKPKAKEPEPAVKVAPSNAMRIIILHNLGFYDFSNFY